MKLTRMLVAAAALSLFSLSSAEIVTVYIFDYDYTTDQTEQTIVDPIIQVGDTIVWQQTFTFGAHTVTSVEGSAEVFDSGSLVNSGDTFQHTFNTPGTYWYYDVIHGADAGNGTATGMSGTVTVVPEPATIALLAAGVIPLLRRRTRS